MWQQLIRTNENAATHNGQQTIGVAQPDGCSTQDPDMRECKTLEELSQLAYDHLDVLSPHRKSAFWTILSKLLQKRGGGPPSTNIWHGQIKEQLYTIICNTMENLQAFDFRDISTTALGLAKL
jgi:hypothetical protein